MALRKSAWDANEVPEEPLPFLQRRGIAPVHGEFTERELGRQLNRRGWRWRLAPDEARATKAFVPMGSTPTSVAFRDVNPITALTHVLAEAMRFDEQHGLELNRPVEADLLVVAPNGRFIALGEVKGGQSLPADEVANVRTSFISSLSEYALAPFFLLFWPDVGYLWDQRALLHPTSPPTVEFPMAEIVARYLPWLNQGERPGATQLELAVANWLDDLANPIKLQTAPMPHVFDGTEFLVAIRGASIATDALV